MSDQLKLTFQLTAHGEELEVRASAPAGEARAEGPLPSTSAIDEVVADPLRIPASRLRPIGRMLYQSLMCGDMVKLAASVLEAGRRAERPVHFELRFDPDQTHLARYPWEMMADDLGRFLVRDGLVDVTRYITYPQPPPTLDTAIRDLPFLQVVSQPHLLQPLAPIDLPIQSVEILSHATFEQLQHRLLIERLAPWGLHFDGHGGLISWQDGKRAGALAFEHNGDVDWISAEDFAAVLYNAHVRLALLMACETACVGDDVVFSGLAPGLVLAGVPAVVGMQYRVLDDFANSFVRSFYAALLEQQDILDAFRTARRMNAREAWYSPVLYLRYKRTAGEDKATRPAYHTRNIDTAVPSEVQAGVSFLVRLWIRRPETKPLTAAELREELDIPEPIAVRTRETEAEIRFEPVEGRRLRRGEVEVRLRSSTCDITPQRMNLFVDEHLDAPPAIFAVRANNPWRASLVFSVWQDGGQIASVTHHIQVTGGSSRPQPVVDRTSHTLPVEAWAPGSMPIPSVPSPGFARQEPAPHPAPKPGGYPMIIAERPGPLPPAELTVRIEGMVHKHHLDKEMVTLGRGSQNDVQIQVPVVSREHARLRLESGSSHGTTYVIYDMGSTNGLTYQGQRVYRHALADGDVIQIGNQVTLQYHQPAVSPPEWKRAAAEPPKTQYLDLRALTGRRINIGRHQSNDLILPDPHVALYHAVIEQFGARFRLRDLQGKGGTFVNGKRVKKEAWIRKGDEIRIVSYKLEFREDGIIHVVSSGMRPETTGASLDMESAAGRQRILDWWSRLKFKVAVVAEVVRGIFEAIYHRVLARITKTLFKKRVDE